MSPAEARRQSPGQRLLPLLLVGAAVAAYANSLSGPFVFDDIDAIVENHHVRQLWPPGRVLSAPPQATVAGRPVVSLSLALNYAVGGLDVRGYHLVNLGVHVLCGLLLYGIVRRTLQCAKLRDRYGTVATGVGWCSALLWLVHPLGTETVNYVVQRTESIMALFFLLTVYCSIRAKDSLHWRSWQIASVGACALGMASKEAMVTAPVIVVLYDVAYGTDGLGTLVRRRRQLYAGLAATWLVLAGLMISGPRSETVGLALGISALDYAKNQCVVVVDYLRHALWPHPLVFDYGYARPLPAGTAAPGAAVLAALVLGTLLLWFRRPAAGFPALWAAVILAPTSSFVPIVSEVGAERRMYLPLAGLVVLFVTTGYQVLGRVPRRLGQRGIGRFAIAVALVVAALLAWATSRRNRDYRTELAIWRTAVEARPLNARAHNNLGRAIHVLGQIDEAEPHYRRALEIDEQYSEAHYNLGVAMTDRGRSDEAIVHYRQALKLNAELPRAHHNLGSELANRGELERAIGAFREAVRLAPEMAQARHSLGRALRLSGRDAEALEHLREAARLDAAWPEPLGDLAWILATHPDDALRDPDEALRLARRAVELSGDTRATTLDTLAAAYAAVGLYEQASATAERALQLATDGGYEQLARSIGNRLQLYRAGRPYREH